MHDWLRLRIREDKCSRRRRSTICIRLKSFLFISIHSSRTIYEPSEAELTCVCAWRRATEVSRKPQKRSSGREGSGRGLAGWRWSGCGNWKGKDRARRCRTVRDWWRWRIARNSVRVRRTYITAPSIYTDELRMPSESFSARLLPPRTTVYSRRPSENGTEPNRTCLAIFPPIPPATRALFFSASGGSCDVAF